MHYLWNHTIAVFRKFGKSYIKTEIPSCSVTKKIRYNKAGTGEMIREELYCCRMKPGYDFRPEVKDIVAVDAPEDFPIAGKEAKFLENHAAFQVKQVSDNTMADVLPHYCLRSYLRE